MNEIIPENYDDQPTRQGLLPFKFAAPTESGYEHRLLQANTQRLFKPRGLLLWDVGTAQLEMMLIASHLELVVDFAPVPARWFTLADSFAAVAKALQEGKEPPGWGSWSAVYPGQQVRLRFDQPQPLAQALMWGEYV